jgi:phosphatidylethanolamine-binding protein (PEBP) family uncharacterized protein
VPNTLGKLLHRVRAGEQRSLLSRRDLAAPITIRITSPTFTDGGVIPTKHAGRGVGDNISPALTWSGQPAGTRQLVLIIEDVDVPLPRPLLHTVALIDPQLDSLDEGALHPGTPGLSCVPAAFGRIGYAGPRPIRGHGVHHYRFHLLALDQPVRDSVTTVKSLLNAIADHILSRGILTGVYQR